MACLRAASTLACCMLCLGVDDAVDDEEVDAVLGEDEEVVDEELVEVVDEELD